MRRRRPLPLIVPFGLLVLTATLASADFRDQVAKTATVTSASAMDVTFAEPAAEPAGR